MTLRIDGRVVPVVGKARVYVCGITPYDTTHLGHAATFVWTDVAVRVLRHLGVPVEVCRNITDVDDPLIEEARRRGVDWRSLATQQTFRFEEDMRLLGVQRPTYEPKSHDHIDDVVTLAESLVTLGAAYARNGSVFFRGAGVAERAGIDRATALRTSAARGGRPDDPDKDDPLDMAVWQRSAPGEPSWDSPWGPGRPGWHAECTAMALANLGTGIDLHGGGADLMFPHHAYEAALAEAVTGVAPFARSWMHVGTVLYRGEKIAKSTGNLVFVHDLLERFPAEAVRLLILDRDWRDPWEYREDDLADAADRLQRLRALASRSGGGAAERATTVAVDALYDDLDAPRSLAIAAEAGGSALKTVGGLLGIL